MPIENHITTERTRAGWIAACPALDISAQGFTESAARRNVAEAVSLFLEAAPGREVFERMGRNVECNASLLQFLTGPRARAALGRAFALRIEVLAQQQTKTRTLSSIAAEYKVTRQSVWRMSRRMAARLASANG